MTSLEHDELLTKCQIFEKETATRPEETSVPKQSLRKQNMAETKAAMLLIPQSARVLANNKGRWGSNPRTIWKQRSFAAHLGLLRYSKERKESLVIA